MECSNCTTICDLPNTGNKNPGIILENGKVICVPCSEVMELLNYNHTPIEKPKVMTTIKKEMMFVCVKCKHNFSGRNCICGFKNPLYR